MLVKGVLNSKQPSLHSYLAVSIWSCVDNELIRTVKKQTKQLAALNAEFGAGIFCDTPNF